MFCHPHPRHLSISRNISREGNGNPLQYSCLENPMDGGAWWAAVYGVAKSRTWLSDFTFTFHFHTLEKEMATPVFFPGESRDGGAWQAAIYGVAQSQILLKRLSSSSSGKESTSQCRRHKRFRFNPWVRKIPWSRKRQPTPVFLPGESHGPRSLVSYSPWDQKESDSAEWLMLCHRLLKYCLKSTSGKG